MEDYITIWNSTIYSLFYQIVSKILYTTTTITTFGLKVQNAYGCDNDIKQDASNY